MLLGFGNLMMMPLRVEYLANHRYGLQLSEAQIALLISTLPNIARLIGTPLWGRIFDTMNFFSLRMVLNVSFLIGTLAFFASDSLALLALSAVLIGFTTAGGDIAWSLWVTKFAAAGFRLHGGAHLLHRNTGFDRASCRFLFA
jgi:MFS family permease